MATYSEKTLFQLTKDLQKLHEELEAREPHLVAEIELVTRLVKAKQNGAQKVYASVSGPTEAIELCLSLAGDGKLTKKEIKREILNGGYESDKPRAANGVLNDTLNQMIRKGNLILKGDLISRAHKSHLPPSKRSMGD